MQRIILALLVCSLAVPSMAQKKTPSLPDYPSFDTFTFCQQTTKHKPDADFLMTMCLKDEEAAYRRLAAKGMPPAIFKKCADIFGISGVHSYINFEKCVNNGGGK